MSKVLAIDTSTSRSCVAIIDGANVLYSGFRDGATAHGPSLPALVQEALAVSDVDVSIANTLLIAKTLPNVAQPL